MQITGENSIQNGGASRAKQIWKRYKPWLPPVLTAVIFVSLFLSIDIKKAVEIIGRLELTILLYLLLITLVVNVLLGTIKFWWLALLGGAKLTFVEAFIARMGNLPVRFVLPLKAGEVFYALYLQKAKNIELSKGIGLMIFDKVANLSALILIVLFGAIGLKSLVPVAVVSIIAVAMILIFGIASIFKKVCEIIKGFSSNFGALFENLSYALWAISLKIKLAFLALSFLFMLSEYAMLYLSLKGVGADVSALNVLFYGPQVTIASILPISISGLGIRELTVMGLFSGAVSNEALLASGFLVSLFAYILPAFFGLPFLKLFLSYIINEKK